MFIEAEAAVAGPSSQRELMVDATSGRVGPRAKSPGPESAAFQVGVVAGICPAESARFRWTHAILVAESRACKPCGGSPSCARAEGSMSAYLAQGIAQKRRVCDEFGE